MRGKEVKQNYDFHILLNRNSVRIYDEFITVSFLAVFPIITIFFIPPLVLSLV